MEVLHLQRAHAQGVDQRVAGVCRVEHGLTADVGQAQAVAVAADAVDNTRQDALGVVGVDRAEAQLVHHGDRAGAHGHDVADDAAHAGGCALVGLHKGRVVVAFHAERHRVAAADVHHTGVLTDAGEDLGRHLLGHGLAEVAQVRLGGLVGAVLGPHDGVQRQLRVGRPAAKDGLDLGVLVVLQPQLGVRLRQLRGVEGVLDSVVVHGHFGFTLRSSKSRR